MAGSKEQERAELHRTIWGIINDTEIDKIIREIGE